MIKRPAFWVAAATAATAVLVGLAALAGVRFFTVMTPSMGTTAPVGTLVVTRPAAPYQVGDVVTFERNNRSYTHRIIAANSDGTFTTKGDLNGAADPLPVTEAEIVGGAVWLAPGMGWLWQGLPWLLLGGLAVYVLSMLRQLDRTWRWIVRISGWTLVFCLVAVWLRPWVSLSQLSWIPSDVGGVDMHVVNTGLFPLDVLGNRLVSGQDAVVHVTEQNTEGFYTLTPTLAFHWWEQVCLFLICVIPFALSFLIREDRDLTPARAAIDPESDDAAVEPEEVAVEEEQSPTEAVSIDDMLGDAEADAEPELASLDRSGTAKGARHHLLLTSVVVLAIIISVSVVGVTATGAAVTAKVTNSSNTAGTRTFFNCRNAISSLPGSTYLAWAMGTSGSSETDIGNTSNKRTGAYSPTVNSTVSDSGGLNASVGCLRDSPSRSINFLGNRCLYVNANYASSGYYPTTFSLEAWFRTSTKSNGKIIGFGSSRNTSSDSSYDRHVYLDKDGRIVFGVYPGAVKVVFTAAGTSYADGDWHHVVATLAGATQKLYVDGESVMSQTVAGPYAEQSHGYWKVGCGNLSGWQNAATAASGSTTLDYNGPSYFTGQIQYAAVYTVALTPTQVTEHYLAGIG